MHKWLLTNFDVSCLYVRERKHLIDAFSLTPSYVRNAASESGLVFDYRYLPSPLNPSAHRLCSPPKTNYLSFPPHSYLPLTSHSSSTTYLLASNLSLALHLLSSTLCLLGLSSFPILCHLTVQGLANPFRPPLPLPKSLVRNAHLRPLRNATTHPPYNLPRHPLRRPNPFKGRSI